MAKCDYSSFRAIECGVVVMPSVDLSPSLSLRKRAISASAWNLDALVTSQAIRLGGNPAMVRLLMPGIMAAATTVSMVLHMLSDLGLRQNIIQSPNGDDPVFLNTVWTVQIVRGVILVTSQLADLLVLLALGYFTRSTWSLVAANLVATMVSNLPGHFWSEGQSNRLEWDRSAHKELVVFEERCGTYPRIDLIKQRSGVYDKNVVPKLIAMRVQHVFGGQSNG